MIYSGHSNRVWEQGPVTIRALSSLTSEASGVVKRAVERAAPDWCVDTIDDYDGYLSIVVSRVDEHEGDPTFLISRRADQIELARLQADQLRSIATFATIEDATATLIGLLG
jgi:hypothetical protein